MDFTSMQQLLADNGVTLPQDVMVSMLQRLQHLQQQQLRGNTPQQQRVKQQDQEEQQQPPASPPRAAAATLSAMQQSAIMHQHQVQQQPPPAPAAAVIAMQQELCRYLSIDLRELHPSGLITILRTCAELGGSYTRLAAACVCVLGKNLEQAPDLVTLSKVLAALARLTANGDDVVEGCWGPLEQQLKQPSFAELAATATPEQIGVMVWATAKLGRQLQATAMKEMLKRFEEVLGQATALDIGKLIWGLGTMGEQGVSEENLVQMVRRVGTGKGGRQSPFTTSCILWGMAALGHKLPPFELKQLLRYLLQNLDQAEPQHLYGVVWGLAKAEQQLEPWQVEKLVVCLIQKRDSASTAAISNILWGVAKLGHTLPSDQLQQLLQALLLKLAQASHQCLAMSLWAVAKMGGQVEPWQLQQLLAGIVAKLPGAGPIPISRTLWAIATLRYWAPVRLLRPVIDAYAGCLAAAKAGEIGAVFCSVATMPVEPFLPASLLTPPARKLILSKLWEMQSRDLANIAWACGKLGYRDDALLDPLYRRAVDLLQQDEEASVVEGGNNSSNSFGAVAVANLCWVAAVLDMQHLAKEVQRLAGRYRNRWEGQLEEYRTQLYQVHVSLLDNKLRGCLPYKVSEEYGEAWKAELAAAEDASQLHQDVFRAALKLPMKFRKAPAMEVTTRDGFLSIDILLVTSGRVPVAIEVDGPHHFRRPDQQPTGSTLWRNRALAARGYVVVSVPYWEWRRVGGGAARKVEYLEKKIGVALAAQGKKEGKKKPQRSLPLKKKVLRLGKGRAASWAKA
jgi:hypothetical protein